MRILVTGGTGFIGSSVVKKLIGEKHLVSVLLRKKSDTKKIKGISYQGVIADLRDYKRVCEAVRDIDVIIHCGALLPHHRASYDDYFDVNILGTQNLLLAAKQASVRRFIHISTVGIYGTSHKLIKESSPVLLTDAYSKSKFEAEKLVRKFGQDGLSYSIIRPTIGYGPGDLRPGFLDLFKFIKSGFYISIGNGDNYFNTIYIENLVDAILLAIRKRSAISEDFIIGDEPCPKMSEIVDIMSILVGKRIPRIFLPKDLILASSYCFDLFKKFGISTPISSRRVKFMTDERRFSIDKAKKILDYNPRIGIKEGLEITYRWYKEKGLL